MNSQVLVDRELLQELADFCSDSRSYNEAIRVLATPAPIPDHLPGVTKMVSSIPDAGEGVEVVGYHCRDNDDKATLAWLPHDRSIPLMTVAQHNRIVSALQADPSEDVRAMVVPKCKCSMSISVLGDGCRYCQPQEYIDRLHDQMEDDLAMVVPDGWLVEKMADNGVSGFIVRTPRAEGVRTCTAVFPDDDDPAHRLLAMLLASPPAKGGE